MNKEYPKKTFYSRLARREDKQNLRKAFTFSFLSVALILATVFFGIPLLTKMAVFFADIKNTNTPVEQTDNIPPAPPRFSNLPEYTKDSSVAISGYAEPSSTVEVFLDGSPVATVVSTNDGTFSFSKIDLKEGDNKLHAVATDAAGNESQPSQDVDLFFDNIPPKLDITSPQDNAKIYGDSNRKVKVAGQSETDVSITVNDRLIIVDQDGNFSATYNLVDGENNLKIVAVDNAGNQTEKNLKVTFNP